MGHSNINIVVGLMVLVLGRKMFWLFVGTVGFLVGMELTGVLLPIARSGCCSRGIWRRLAPRSDPGGVIWCGGS